MGKQVARGLAVAVGAVVVVSGLAQLVAPADHDPDPAPSTPSEASPTAPASTTPAPGSETASATSRVTVAEGTYERGEQTWTLRAWRRADETLCVQLDGSMTCGSRMRPGPDGEILAFSGSSSGSADGPTHGCMSSVTAASGTRLEVVFLGGLVRPLRAHQVDDPRFPVRFFASCWIGHRRVVGARLLGSDGQVLDRIGEEQLDRRVEVPLEPDDEWTARHAARPVGVAVLRGRADCGGAGTTVLEVAWPLDGAPGDREVRQYVRDPRGVLADRAAVAFDADAGLPEAAAWTGYSTLDVDLWVDASTVDTRLFVATLDRVEQWPRLQPPLTCLE